MKTSRFYFRLKRIRQNKTKKKIVVGVADVDAVVVVHDVADFPNLQQMRHHDGVDFFHFPSVESRFGGRKSELGGRCNRMSDGEA